VTPPARLTSIASSPLPVWMKALGSIDVMARQRVVLNKLVVERRHRACVRACRPAFGR